MTDQSNLYTIGGIGAGILLIGGTAFYLFCSGTNEIEGEERKESDIKEENIEQGNKNKRKRKKKQQEIELKKKEREIISQEPQQTSVQEPPAQEVAEQSPETAASKAEINTTTKEKSKRSKKKKSKKVPAAEKNEEEEVQDYVEDGERDGDWEVVGAKKLNRSKEQYAEEQEKINREYENYLSNF